MSTSPGSNRRALVWFLVLILFVVHQDWWWWDNRTLVLGFLPIGLFYHALFSIAAAGVWALANTFAWPEEIEAWAAAGDPDTPDQGGQG